MNNDKPESEAQRPDCKNSGAASCSTACPYGQYKGQLCACAECHPEDGVCVAPESGGGCGECDGPVSEHCDLVDYE